VDTACYVVSTTGAPASLLGPAPAQPTADPRLALALPWASSSQRHFYLVSALFALVLLVVPAALLIGAVRWRSWPLGLLLVAYAGLAGYAYVAEWIPRQLNFFTEFFIFIDIMKTLQPVLTPLEWLHVKIDVRWLRAVIGLPLVLFALALLAWLVRRRWQRLALLLAAVLLAGASTGVVMLWLDESRFDPAQYYAWDGWYWLLFFGAYFTGLLVAALWLLGRAVRLVRWIGGRRRQCAPAPASG
jgi:hypothetical protein